MFTQKKNILSRYLLIIFILAILGVLIGIKAGIVMFGERRYWSEVQARFVKEGLPVEPKRGNILSDNGELMASTLPEYRIYMDFVTNKTNIQNVHDALGRFLKYRYFTKKSGGEEKNGWNKKDSLQALKKALQSKDSVKVHKILKKDSLISLSINMEAICKGMERIIDDPEWSASRFKTQILKGQKVRSRYFQLYPKRISYLKYKDLLKLPVFSQSANSGGFFAEGNNQRKRPFGSLAKRTLGELFQSKDSARFGIELSYDSILRGKPGVKHREKVGNRFVDIIDKPAVNGYDIQTTLNVEMQDICEKALTDMLKKLGANVGLSLLMEVQSGDIKAMVNMSKSGGSYQEIKNNAIADLMEPGSTFKTVSMVIALNDKKVTLQDSVFGFNGIHKFHKENMKDHNYSHGGYQWMTIPEVLMYSSNIGIAQIIDNNYGNNPDAYIDKLYEMGLGENFHLLKGEGTPIIPHKKGNKHWSKITLPWMAMGYNTQIPAINIVTFYNAIANNGKMVKPRLVRSIRKEGRIIHEYPVEVVREKICEQHTIDDITEILTRVVNDPKGLGKKAKSENFLVAGKTGTAQISQGAAGYKSGTIQYLLSFCGFFPADNPKYTCLVQIQNTGGPASGGATSGVVVGEIARRVMAKHLTLPLEEAVDTLNPVTPLIKNGNLDAASYVLDKMEIEHRWADEERKKEIAWGRVLKSKDSITLKYSPPIEHLVPNLLGMGAKDAVYLAELSGLRVSISGTGKVRSQTPQPGIRAIKGSKIELMLK